MKEHTIGSAAWKRQKVTQEKQRAAAARRAEKPWVPAKGQKYLHPERRKG